MNRQLSALVLLISDDEELGRSMRGQLENDGIDVLQTLYCSDAGVLIQRHDPDLIAVDMTLSSMNGSRLVELAENAKTHQIPFVLVSSRPAVEVAELARLIRATGIISRRTAADRIAVPVRRWIPDGSELDIGPLVGRG